ncbi:hypothetical protein N9D31_03295 [Oligoflexaceae bacterium]|nr:hypothetical protein [Oligoflexaceae bacterium]
MPLRTNAAAMVFAVLQTLVAEATCPSADQYTLRAFNLEDRLHSQSIRIAFIKKNLEDRKDDLKLQVADLKSVRHLHARGYVNYSQVNAAKVAVEEAEIERDRQLFSLEAVASEKEILKRQLEEECLSVRGDIEEIKEYAEIFYRKWKDASQLDPREIALAEKKRKMSHERLEWMKDMEARGYRNGRDVLLAQIDYNKFDRLITALNTAMKTKRTFANDLLNIIES